MKCGYQLYSLFGVILSGKSVQFLVPMTHFLSVVDLKKCVLLLLTDPGFQGYKNGSQHVKHSYFKCIILTSRVFDASSCLMTFMTNIQVAH